MSDLETTQDAFHPMRGHVADGTSVLMNNGETVDVKAVMGGWVVETWNGPSRTMQSAAEVAAYIVRYPESDA